MKRKKLVLFVAIILILVVGGLAIIYFKTDLFKAPREKFFKYINSNSKITQLYNNEDVQSIKNRRSKNAYEVNSNIKLKKDNNEYVADINTKANNSNDVMTSVEMQYNNRSIANFKLKKQSNLIAVKFDELASGYIAIKNNNIKQLAKEAGIENTDNIPDTINWCSLLDILYVSQSDEKYFSNMISDIISNNTAKSNYSADESESENIASKCNGYTLKLSQNDAKKIAIAFLKHITEDDSRMLNFISSKAKLLNLPEKYTNVKSISKEIQDCIEKLENIKTTDDSFIQITVYVEKGKVIQTNIRIDDASIITIVVDNAKVTMKQDRINKALAKSSNKLANYLAYMKEISLAANISEDKNSVETKFIANFYNDTSIEFSSKTKIVESIEENKDFIESSKIILNELETDKLKKLYVLLEKNFMAIIEEKANFIGISK